MATDETVIGVTNVAAVVPIASEPVELWGMLRGTVTIAPGVDLAAPTGEMWDADR